ncbi:MAG: sulfatase-like hydrolase/transferase [Gammaproteobacteria bacterium]|nr:sulfatase-like hydrolase/transferase [Gammaproteobacteria bacterium]
MKENQSVVKTLCRSGLLAAFVAGAPAAMAANTKPNILLIISDDIGFDATTEMYPGFIENLVKQYGPSGHNHPDYKMIQGHPASTPNLNALAKSGMKFSQAWVNTFCSPTRTSMLTGLYSVKTGVLDYLGYLSQTHRSFVRDLKEQGGYSTGLFGKWHIAGLGQYPGMKTKEAGFDIFLGNMHGGVQTYWEWDYHIQDSSDAPDQYRTEKAPIRSLPGIAPTTFAPVVKAADAIQWITEQETKNPDKPWFTWFAFNLAHITGQQQPNPMVIPNADTLDERSRKEMEACLGPDGQFGSALVGTCSSEALMRAMTNAMDTITGRLIETVDKLDPNTYIIYIGDNGTWMFGDKREFIDNMYITRRGRSKGTAYESGVRVAMAVRGPNIKAGTSSDEWVNGVDLFATILQLAGLDVPKTVPNRTGDGMVPIDSVSLTPLLFQKAQHLRDPDKDYQLAETVNPVSTVKPNLKQAAARNATYKVICDENPQTESCTFYNLKNDPLEEYPLAKPVSCADYSKGSWTPAKPEWHFCRLQEVLTKESFIGQPNYVKSAVPQPAPAGRGAGRGAGPGAAGRGAGPGARPGAVAPQAQPAG